MPAESTGEATGEGVATIALEIPEFWNSGVVTKDNGSYEMKQSWTYETSCVYCGGQDKKYGAVQTLWNPEDLEFQLSEPELFTFLNLSLLHFIAVP